jgi:hypothetical protein
MRDPERKHREYDREPFRAAREFMAKFVSVKKRWPAGRRGGPRSTRDKRRLVVAAIQAVPDEELETDIPLPWGPKTWGTKTLRDICAIPTGT